MKNLISISLFILFLSSQSISQSANNFVVKSLNVYTTDNKTSFPVVTKNNKLVIEFDVQARFTPNMNVVFRFCDNGWTPTRNTFLVNPLRSTGYFIDFEELKVTVEDAHFHSMSTFPDDKGDVEFPFSGKWRFYLTDTQDTSIVYGTGKFYIVKDDVNLDIKVKRDELENQNYWPAELAKTFNVTTDFYLPDNFYPSFVDRIEIIDNQRNYYPIIVDRNSNTLFRQFKWDANRSFTFTARDIPAGNEFRQVDLRDHNFFIAKDVKAQRDGLEFSRFFLNPLRKDLNGSKIFVDFKDDFATYLNVTFSIRPPDEVYNDLFLVGAFNDWHLSLDYRLNEEEGVYSITIPLKRGIYDYQYVAADVVDGEIIDADWLILEGNTWVNTKEYDVFLYYKDPDFGGYERIIGYSRITTK